MTKIKGWESQRRFGFSDLQKLNKKKSKGSFHIAQTVFHCDVSHKFFLLRDGGLFFVLFPRPVNKCLLDSQWDRRLSRKFRLYIPQKLLKKDSYLMFIRARIMLQLMPCKLHGWAGFPPCSFLFGTCIKKCQDLFPLNPSWDVFLRNKVCISMKHTTYTLYSSLLPLTYYIYAIWLSPASEFLNELSKLSKSQTVSDQKAS